MPATEAEKMLLKQEIANLKQERTVTQTWPDGRGCDRYKYPSPEMMPVLLLLERIVDKL
jgi:hypothetical protein